MLINRICTKCGQTKPLTSEYFKRAKWIKSGFRGACRICLRAATRFRYWKNPEETRAKALLKRKKLKGSIQRTNQRYHQKHGGKIRAWQRDYHHAHPFLMRARAANRWAQKKGCQGTVTGRDLAGIYHQQRGRCFYCDTKLDKNFEVDHKDSLSRKGPNIPANICCACRKCNQAKKAKAAEEYIKQRAA